MSVIITNWFNLKRGFAVSLALCGSAFGGAILSPIVGNLIATSGWRFAFVVLAVICLVGSLPIAVIFFRSHPSDKGLQPYGAELTEDEIKAIESKGKKKVVQADPEVTVAIGWKVMKKSAAFWLLALGFMLVGAINAMIVVNTISNMTSVVMNGETIDTDWTGTLKTGSVVLTDVNEKAAAAGTAEAIAEAKAKLEDGSLNVFDTATFTVEGKKLDSYMADVDTDKDYTKDTEAVENGVFYESKFRSAPYFDVMIDGINLLDTNFGS